jgi:hypothetical protein
VVSAVAIAAGTGPKISPVEASIVVTFAEGDSRSCEGPGGETFVEQRVRVLGTAEGSPQLSGDVELSLRLLNENSTGESFQKGRLEGFEFEIPPLDEDLAGRRAAGQRVGWLNR